MAHHLRSARPFGRNGRIRTVVALASLVTGCADAANVARTDQPAPLLALSDSLEQERFRGIVVAEVPEGGLLQLRFRDPGGCGRPVDPLRRFAEHAAARAVTLFRPQLMPHPTTVDRVRVLFSRTHRFGVFVWTTSLGEYSFPVSALHNVTVPAATPCGSLSPLLRQQSDSAPQSR